MDRPSMTRSPSAVPCTGTKRAEGLWWTLQTRYNPPTVVDLVSVNILVKIGRIISLLFSTSMRNPDGRAGLTLRYERTESHVLMLRTLLRRKCGKSELRARLDDVKWANSLAYRNRCLNVRSATASRNKKPAAMAKRSTAAVTTIIFSLQKHFLKKSFNFLVFMVLSHNLLHFDDNGNKSNCRMKLPGWGAEEDVTDHRGTVKETIPSWRLDQIQNGSPNGSVDPVNDWQ